MKNLVFIDIESSYSKDISSVCCISLILVDCLTLKEIEKTTYFINSEMIYDNHGKNAKVDIGINPLDLKYAPNLKERYKQLKKYLNNKYFVVGHAIDNDIRMLNAATKKYNLEKFEFKFFCSQMLYRLFKGDKNNKSLDKIATELNEQFTHHHCEEDVLMSLKTIRYICNSLNLTIEEVLRKYHINLGESKKEEVKEITSKLTKKVKKN